MSETISITNLPTGTPSTDDILVFVDRADGVTKRADWSEFPAAAGDVTGPASSTDNALVRMDGEGSYPTIEAREAVIDRLKYSIGEVVITLLLNETK